MFEEEEQNLLAEQKHEASFEIVLEPCDVSEKSNSLNRTSLSLKSNAQNIVLKNPDGSLSHGKWTDNEFSQLNVCSILGKRLDANSDQSLQSVAYRRSND